MDLSTFLVMLLSFTGATVTVIWVTGLAIGRLKRLGRNGPGQLSADELEEIRARLADLEQRDLRVEEIAERLDFMERVLGRAREGETGRAPPARE
jgi:transcriptional regulator GlxA family with amidase domain